MRNRLKIAYNPYFIVPFLLWVIAGGILLKNCDQQRLFAFVNLHYNNTADIFMYYITMVGQAEVIIPVLALLMLIRTYRTLWYFITATVCNIVPFLVQQCIKSYYDEPRPLKLYGHAAWIHFLPQWPDLSARSFPSGHSAGAFSFLCFLALLLPQQHRKWGLLFFALALTVCYSRLYLAAHFFDDVYAGSIIGVVTTTIIFTIMHHYKGLFSKKENA